MLNPDARRTDVANWLRTTLRDATDPMTDTQWKAAADILLTGPLSDTWDPAKRRNHTALILTSLFSDSDAPITEPHWYQHADALLAHLDISQKPSTP